MDKIFRASIIMLCFLSACTQKPIRQDSPPPDLYWGSDGSGVNPPLLQAARLSLPSALKPEFGAVDVTVYGIDLDSDGKGDFIVHHNDQFKTCFIKSDLSKRSCEKLGYGDGFAYYWFAQLDHSPMLELFSMVGDEDYDDYRLYAFDPDTWQRKVLFGILPVIVARKNDPKRSGIYWGYPWDVRGLFLKPGNPVTIRASFDYQPSYEFDERDKGWPVIFFDGLPTQGEEKGDMSYLEEETDGKARKSRYYSLQELLNQRQSNKTAISGSKQ